MKPITNKKTFIIEVWYRFVSAGEQEKEFEIHSIKADNIQEAVNMASDRYKTHSAIPFKFLFEGNNYKPNNFSKELLFGITKPI